MSQENSSTGELKDSMDSVENLTIPGLDIDYNDASRKIISACLGSVPECGIILSSLVDIFWPATQKDVWVEIKDKVEALVNLKIEQSVYKTVQEDLAGIKNNLDVYLHALKNLETPANISSKYDVLKGLILHDLPHFQSTGYETLLLPLFAQLANIHIALLSDGCLYGIEKMGWVKKSQDEEVDILLKTIQGYSDYVSKWIDAGIRYLQANTPPNTSTFETWTTVNKFRTEITLSVDDFRNMWIYFDPRVNIGQPKQVKIVREIYSDPVGWPNSHEGGFYMYLTPPSKPISSLMVWESAANDRMNPRHIKNFNGVLATFPQGCGPDGMNNNKGTGKIDSGSPYTIDLTKKSITKVSVLAGKFIYSMWFEFSDGSISPTFGGNEPQPRDNPQVYTFSYPGEIVSNIQIMGSCFDYGGEYMGSANCAVFGFKYPNEMLSNTNLLEHAHLRTLYITSPNKMEPKKLAGLSGVKDIDTKAEEIKGWIKNHNWDNLREQHWNRLSKELEDSNS